MNSKLKFNFFWLLFITFSTNFCLTQNPGIILAPNFINGNVPGFFIQPLPTSPTPNGYAGQPAQRSQNIQMDAQGNILFFVVDENIYDRQGKFLIKMRIGSHSASGSTYTYDNLNDDYVANGVMEVCIVPVPGQCQEYYIVTNSKGLYAGASDGIRDLAYGKIRIEYVNNQISSNAGFYEYNNGSSTFSAFNGSTSNFWMEPLFAFNQFHWTQGNLNSPCIRTAVSKVNSAGNRYLFLSGSLHLWRYEITPQGIINPTQIFDYVSYFGSLGGYTQNYVKERGEMEITSLSNGNYRLAYPFNKSNPLGDNAFHGVLIMDLNPSGNVINNSIRLRKYYDIINTANSITHIRGLEFSPDGSKLYVAHGIDNVNYPNALESLDLSGSTLNPTPINAMGSNDFSKSQLETNVNGEIYMVNATRLAKIVSPNGSWNNSNYINNAFALGFNYNLSNQGLGATSGPINESFLLSDQIDGENYNAHFTNPQCCVDFAFYHRNTYVATTNATWSNTTVNPLSNSITNTILIKNELRIPAGKTISISNMTFKFAPGAKVIIENGVGGLPGGKLTMNNSVFTVDSTCGANKLWLGVEVWGNPTLAQTSVTQGQLIMNSSKIEHAHIGALVSQRNASNIYSFNDARNGGIVKCVGSTFFNNIRGVMFRKYISPNLAANNFSYFSKCIFRWNGSLLEGSPQVHAQLESVKGISFLGTEFRQETPQLYTPSTSGTGILARESQFLVNQHCTNTACPTPISSVFLNLTNGIRTTNSNALSYTVNKSKFVNCWYGINTTGTKKEIITLNSFEVAELTYQSAGIVLNNSTGYTIEENNFKEFNNPNVAHGSGISYGILVHNSGTAPNEIYKNTFQNLRIGGQSQGINGTANTVPIVTGLRWKCNIFRPDIYLTDLGVNGTIDYNQGNVITTTNLLTAIQSAAGNEFSLFNENQTTYPTHDITVHPSSPLFKYVYIGTPTHTPDNYTLTKVNPLVAQFANQNLTITTGGCPSHLNPPLPIIDTETELDSIISAIGETESLMEVTASGTPAMEALREERSNLEHIKQRLYNNIGSRLLLDETPEATVSNYEEFLLRMNDKTAWEDLISIYIDNNRLDNDSLRDSLTDEVSQDFIDLTLVQEEIRASEESIGDVLTAKPLLTDILEDIVTWSEDEATAMKAKCLLGFITPEEPVFEFWPLTARSMEGTASETSEGRPIPSVVMYPNPSDGKVNFRFGNVSTDLDKTMSIQLFTLSGTELYSNDFVNQEEVVTDFSHLSAGVYLIKILENGIFVESKMLKIK